MSTHHLLGHRAYWGLVGEDVEEMLDFDLLASGKLFGVRPGRLDVCLHEEISSRVTVERGPTPSHPTFHDRAFFPAGEVKLDDSDAGYVLTDVVLPHAGDYEVSVIEGDRVEGHRTFLVTLDPA